MDLVKILPIDLVYMILNYICFPQPTALRADIVSYTSTMQCICKFYKNLYLINLHWLEKDILYYANNYVPMIVGFQQRFREILNRFYIVPKKMNFSNKTTIKRRINMLWGMLTNEERAYFISCLEN